MENKLYRINGSIVTKEQYFDKLEIALDKFRFASTEQLTVALKARPKELSEILYDYIIKYAKQENITTVKDICTKLKVKKQYVLDLIEAGRLEISKEYPEDLDEIEKNYNVVNNALIKQIERQNAISGLSNAFGSTQTQSADKLQMGFHTDYHRKK